MAIAVKTKVASMFKVKEGVYTSKGKTVIFGVCNPFGSQSYLLAFRHREKKPFGVVGRSINYFKGADAESRLNLADGEKALPVNTGPCASITTFYKYADVARAEKVMVLKAYAKGRV